MSNARFLLLSAATFSETVLCSSLFFNWCHRRLHVTFIRCVWVGSWIQGGKLMPSDLNWKEHLWHSAVSRGHVLTDKLTALVKIESLNSIVNLTGLRRGHVWIIHKLQILSCRTFWLLTRQKDIHLQCSFTHTHTQLSAVKSAKEFVLLLKQRQSRGQKRTNQTPTLKIWGCSTQTWWCWKMKQPPKMTLIHLWVRRSS